jgi:hypothetical protein
VIVAFTAVVFLASAAIGAYLTDWIGLSIAPSVVLVASALTAAAVFISLRRSLPSEHTESIPFAATVVSILTWLMWLARPSFLPIGSGPDLTHHLALIDFVERGWRLPHDPLLAARLGEMVNYTPGAHLLAAMAGAWTRTDGFHAIYPIIAFSVALKAGLIFLVARRLMPDRVQRTAWSLAAVLLLFAPRDYFIGSFAEASFLAQVVSEMFAIAMWLAIVVWTEHPSAPTSALIGVFGVATFLAWPVALGPVALMAAGMIALRSGLTMGERFRHLAIAIAPIAAVAGLHALGRTSALAIVGVAGYVAYPRASLFGWWFLVPAAAGVAISAFDRRTRSVTLFLIAIALQAAALLLVARRANAARPYMALKMVYLAIYPMAVAGSLALAAVEGGIGRMVRMGWTRMNTTGAPAATLRRGQATPRRSVSVSSRWGWGPSASAKRMGGTGRTGSNRETEENLFPSSLSRLSRLTSPSIFAWATVFVLAFAAVRSATRMPRLKPAVSQTLFQAGAWARTNLKPECLDYIVDDVYSAYWLHIAVLRNARATPRSTDDDTYVPERQRVRWVVPDGLLYAIAQDFDRLPKDVRSNVDIVARFGRTAIIKRRGHASCVP